MNPRPYMPWLSASVLDLVTAAIRGLDASSLPVLADALEEAGYDDRGYLDQMRASDLLGLANLLHQVSNGIHNERYRRRWNADRPLCYRHRWTDHTRRQHACCLSWLGRTLCGVYCEGASGPGIELEDGELDHADGRCRKCVKLYNAALPHMLRRMPDAA